MFYNFCFYFLLFLIYSFLGWICEIVGCSITDKKIVLNRGFLFGPYLPIFGFSGVLMVLFFKRYFSFPLALFVMATIICTIIEYVTSYIMEKIFKTRWWDYSDRKFHINGRVSLTTSSLFGLLGLLLMYIINPFITNVLYNIPKVILIVIGIFLFLVFMFDFVLSTILMFELKVSFVKFGDKDATSEIKKQVHEYLSKHKIFTGRLIDSFPKAKSLFSNDPFEEIKLFLESKQKKK